MKGALNIITSSPNLAIYMFTVVTHWYYLLQLFKGQIFNNKLKKKKPTIHTQWHTVDVQ